jgi:hypothetical protein
MRRGLGWALNWWSKGECVINARRKQAAHSRRGSIRGSLSLKSSTETRTHFPAPDSGEQEERFSRAFSILREAIAARAFPGATAAVTHRGKLVACAGFGHFTYDAGAPAVTAETVFDLA